jgi:glycerophosphoryl diester phosphodiesterase
MKIIGHRGAAGLALENTLESIRSAIKAGVDAIEVDVRLTKDHHLVLSHDEHLGRVSSEHTKVHETALRELRELKLHNGKRIPTLQEAIKAVGDTPLIIDAKDDGWAEPLARIVSHERGKSISVVSFNHDELKEFSHLCPHVDVYALEHTSPIDVIHGARDRKLTGIDINFWILNPLTYYLARRYNLKVIVYTVNYVWIARFLKVFYPNISITTNNPDRLGFLSDIKKRERATKRTSTKRSRSRQSHTAAVPKGRT